MKAKRMITLGLMVFALAANMAAKDIRTAIFKVEQMHCPNCERKVKENIRFEKGLKNLATDVKSRTVTITYDADKTNIENLKKGFEKISYTAEFVSESKKEKKGKE